MNKNRQKSQKGALIFWFYRVAQDYFPILNAKKKLLVQMAANTYIFFHIWNMSYLEKNKKSH